MPVDFIGTKLNVLSGSNSYSYPWGAMTISITTISVTKLTIMTLNTATFSITIKSIMTLRNTKKMIFTIITHNTYAECAS